MDGSCTPPNENEWQIPKLKRIQRKEKPHNNQSFRPNQSSRVQRPRKFQSSILSSVQEYQVSYRHKTFCQPRIRPRQQISITDFPTEILALISSFFWTVPKERDNRNFSFVEDLPSGKIVCMMLKLGLCSQSLLRFVSKKYAMALDIIREISVQNFIQTLRSINIDMKKEFDGGLGRSSAIYHQFYSLNPKVSLEKVYDRIQKKSDSDTDYPDLLSKLWYTSCFYDPSLAKHLSKNHKSLTLEHFHNGFKLGICAGKSYIVAYLLNNVIQLGTYNIIFNGLRDGILCRNKRICEIISKYIIKTEDFWSDLTIKNFFASCSWSEKHHIENLCTIIKEFGIYTLFRLGNDSPIHIFNSDYNRLEKIIKTAIKFNCDQLICLIRNVINKHLDRVKLPPIGMEFGSRSPESLTQAQLPRLTIDNYKSYVRENTIFDLNTQQLYLLRVILKEGILTACSEGNLHMFNVLDPIKVLAPADIRDCWEALQSGRVFTNDFRNNDPETGFASRLVLDLFSLTAKITRINFIPSISSNLINLIFNVMCYKFETMVVLMDFPDFDISFHRFALIGKAIDISAKQIIKRIFLTKKSQLTRFFSTIDNSFFNCFKYSGETIDLEFFLMFLSDSRMRLSSFLEEKFISIYQQEKAVPYTLAIIQTPHLQFELFFGEFIQKHSLERAPKEIISALVKHKKIYQTYNFELMIGNLLLGTPAVVIKNLEIMIGL